MLAKYILDDEGQPVRCDDLLIWAAWFENSAHDRSRVIKQDYAEESDRVGVSTVFLGLDHAFGGGPPVLWESMVFGTSLDGTTARYTSRADALRGHDAMLARVRAVYDEERGSSLG